MPETDTHAETLYASPNLTVTRRAPHASATLVITFQSFIDDHEPPRGGFGEQFLRHNGFDAIHITSHSNAWYQYPDIPAALETVRTAAACATTRVTYGLSMGAYAAARFARDVGADRVIAISPQFSIDRRRVPFERRWKEFGDTLPFICDWPERAQPGGPAGPEVAAIYDPHNLDRHHVALLAGHLPLRHVRVPYGGHPVTALLNEAGVLPGLILDLLHDRFDERAFTASLAERSPLTAAYHAVQADLLPRRETARRLALHRRAAELAPEDRHIQRGFGMMLTTAGHHADAVEQLRRCLDSYPNDPFTAQALSKALSASGQITEAVAVAATAVEISNGRIGFVRNLAAIRRRERVARWLEWVRIRRPSAPHAP